MKSCFAASVVLMLLFFQCSMNLPQKPRPVLRNTALVNVDADQLIRPEGIDQFLGKLHRLQTGKGDSALTIVHIGDSHIQMGYFSGEVRNALQAQFGGQGIGIFFPNSLCSGYNPLGLDISSPSNWQCEKITSPDPVIPLGIVGMGMKSSDPLSTINISFKGKKEKVRTFTIFHENVQQTHEITCDNGQVATHNLNGRSSVTIVTLSEETDTAFIHFKNTDGGKMPMIVYGISVNSPIAKGINYNTFGVSGGQYKYFAKNTPLLAEQLEALKPDLVIVSLGSNDSYDKKLTAEEYRDMVRSFVLKLKAASPGTEIILTTPPDTQFKDSKPVSGNIVYQGILDAGKQAGCTVWDFYNVMGGYGSVKRWKKQKLGNKDGLHLTSEGYYLQGQLFTLALARAMEQKYPGNGWLPKTEVILAKTLRQ